MFLLPPQQTRITGHFLERWPEIFAEKDIFWYLCKNKIGHERIIRLPLYLVLMNDEQERAGDASIKDPDQHDGCKFP